MKITIILVLFSLIALSVSRTEKKKKKLSAAKAAASAKKRVKMPRIFDVKVFVNDATNPTSATLDAKPIKQAAQSAANLAVKQYGLHLKTASVTPEFQAISFKNAEEYFIPYRYMFGQFTINTSQVQAKSISCTISVETAGKTTTHLVKIQFDYDPEWEIVTDSDLTTLVDWINTAKSKARLSLNEDKEEVSKYANEYINNKNSFEAASKNIDEVNNLITTYENKDKDLQTQNEGFKSQYKTLLAQLSTAETELIALKTNENNLITQVNNQGNLLKQLNSQLSVLKSDDLSSSDNIKTLEGELNAIKQNFESAIAVLVPEAAETKNLLDQAKTSLYGGNLSDCTNKIASSVA